MTPSPSPQPQMPSRAPQQAPADGLQKLGRLADQTGRNIVELAGALDQIDADAAAQLGVVQDVSLRVGDLMRVAQTMTDGLGSVSTASDRARQSVESSVTTLRASSEQSRDVAEWVARLDTTLASVEGTLDNVQRANHQIVEIAKQVNILAVNARIEAARTGEAGKGFAVIAEAINQLSDQTSKAALDVSSSTATLGELLADLRVETQTATQNATDVLEGAANADSFLARIDTDVRAASEDAHEVSSAAEEARAVIEQFSPAFDGLSQALQNTAQNVHGANKRADAIVDITEMAVQVAVQMGASNEESALIELVQDRAVEIGAMFEAAIQQGRISLAALFDNTYTPIPGTDPQQVMAPFTELTDALLPKVQERVASENPRVIFCAAVDRNGYLPTHNQKFSQPQGSDPVWNAANCRNRRLFNDRVGLKAGQNSAPFLMQTYRRDMGGGQFVLMKDLSAPIFVNGRHWGGLRMGVDPSK